MSNSLKSINSIVDEILAKAKAQIGESLITRSGAINSAFDDAYGSCLGHNYAVGMECVAQGLKWLDELLAYADEIAPTASGSEWEWVRDALGPVNMEKAPIEDSIRKDYERKISWYVSPGFGTKPRHVVYWYDGGKRNASEDFVNFRKLLDEGRLDRAEMHWNGAAFDYDIEKGRWIFDCEINPASRPELKKYM